MLVALVDVAAAGVGLPDLDELVGHWAPIAVDNPAGDDNAFADRLPGVLDGEVSLERFDVLVPEARRPALDGLRVGMVQVLRGVAQDAASVRRVVESWLGPDDLYLPVGGLDPSDLGADFGLRRGVSFGRPWCRSTCHELGGCLRGALAEQLRGHVLGLASRRRRDDRDDGDDCGEH